MLVSIADSLWWEDLQNLRLVNKRFHSVVGQSAIKLHPHEALTSAQLLKLGQLFRNAAQIRITLNESLGNDSLRDLHTLFPRLRILTLSGGSLLTDAGVAHLNPLSRLQFLMLRSSEGLAELPDAISGLTSLQYLSLHCHVLRALPEGINALVCLRTLDLRDCAALERFSKGITGLSTLQHLSLPDCNSLRVLPEGLSCLVSLRSLYLFNCEALEELPKGLGALSLLEKLNLDCCDSLTGLPNSISRLSSLKTLSMNHMHIPCRHAWTSLPSTIGSLTALTELQLGRWRHLRALPESLGGFSKLERLNLEYCGSLGFLPDGISRLSALRSMDLRGCDSLRAPPEGLRRLIPPLHVRVFCCRVLENWLAGAAEGVGSSDED